MGERQSPGWAHATNNGSTCDRVSIATSSARHVTSASLEPVCPCMLSSTTLDSRLVQYFCLELDQIKKTPKIWTLPKTDLLSSVIIIGPFPALEGNNWWCIIEREGSGRRLEVITFQEIPLLLHRRTVRTGAPAMRRRSWSIWPICYFQPAGVVRRQWRRGCQAVPTDKCSPLLLLLHVIPHSLNFFSFCL